MVSKLLDLVTKKKKNRQYLPSLEKNVMDFRKVVRALHVCFEQMTLRNGTESPEMVVSSVAPSVSSLMTELSWGRDMWPRPVRSYSLLQTPNLSPKMWTGMSPW